MCVHGLAMSIDVGTSRNDMVVPRRNDILHYIIN